MSKRQRLFAVLAVGVMLAAAGCSGSGGDDVPASVTPQAASSIPLSPVAETPQSATAIPRPTITPAPTATAVPAPTATPVPTAAPRATSTLVPTPTLAPTPTPTTTPIPTPRPVFAPGVYYRIPGLANPGAMLAILGGAVTPQI
ncbi:MAG: hypothetical protein EXR49_09340 [Dehalococcoidia bacterium]|nr:hypothetical protein [Dehalococcoidia bacterium]